MPSRKRSLRTGTFLQMGIISTPIDDATQALLLAAGSTRVRRSENKDGTVKQIWDAPSAPRSSWQAVGDPDAPTWKLSGTQGTSALWKNWKAPLPLPKRMRPFCYVGESRP